MYIAWRKCQRSRCPLPSAISSYVIAVAKNGSVTAAAEELGISQPAVSAALRSVEAEYGLSLFIRERPHRIALTAVGRRFVGDARRLLEEADEFDADAREMRDAPEGMIEVGCFTPTAPFVIPLVLQRLEEKFPASRSSCTKAISTRSTSS